MKKASCAYGLPLAALLALSGCGGGGGGDTPAPTARLAAFPKAGLHANTYQSAAYGTLQAASVVTQTAGGATARIVFFSKTYPQYGAGSIVGSFALNQDVCFEGTETYAGRTGSFRLSGCSLSGDLLSARVESTLTSNKAGAPGGPTAKALAAPAASAGDPGMQWMSVLTEADFANLYVNAQPCASNTPFTATATDASGCATASTLAATKSYFTYANFADAYLDFYTNWATVNASGKYTSIPPEPIFKAPEPTDPVAAQNAIKDMNKRQFAALLGNATQETNGWTPPNAGAAMTTTNPLGLVVSEGGLALGLLANDEITQKWGGLKTYGDLTGYCTGKTVDPLDNNAPIDNPIAMSTYDNDCPSPSPTSDYCRMAKAACDLKVNSLNDHHGRGALQLTGASNYINYGAYIQPATPTSLATNPDQIVATNAGKLGWAVGVGYWALPAAQPDGGYKPTPRQLMAPTADQLTSIKIIAQNGGATGFGQTINLINGGIECGQASQFTPWNTLNRINAYLEALLRLNLDNGIAKVVVTQVDKSAVVTSTHTYTGAQLLANINNPRVKSYTDSKAGAQATNYTNEFQPGWVVNQTKAKDGFNYLTHPLIDEYYIINKQVSLTNIGKIVLTYADGTSERLDCTGYVDYAQTQ